MRQKIKVKTVNRLHGRFRTASSIYTYCWAQEILSKGLTPELQNEISRVLAAGFNEVGRVVNSLTLRGIYSPSADIAISGLVLLGEYIIGGVRESWHWVLTDKGEVFEFRNGVPL